MATSWWWADGELKTDPRSLWSRSRLPQTRALSTRLLGSVKGWSRATFETAEAGWSGLGPRAEALDPCSEPPGSSPIPTAARDRGERYQGPLRAVNNSETLVGQ